jgi:hypothetical protein
MDPGIRHQNIKDPQHCCTYGTHFLQCVTANLLSLFSPCLDIALLDMNIFLFMFYLCGTTYVIAVIF